MAIYGKELAASSVASLPALLPIAGASAVGTFYQGNGVCTFCVWAPFLSDVSVRILYREPVLVPLERDEQGYWRRTVGDIPRGTRYLYRLNDDKERPDPASRSQPDGVHAPSQVVDPVFLWQDNGWKGIPLKDLIIYELHIGAFTTKGTFEAAISRLDHLVELGVTAIEIMPVAQFPGTRNWGYDGVYPFAPQNSYGGTSGLKTLVNACHRKGLAVILDVVYNHLGPDGNYLNDFGPYFTNRYRTPWGDAVNLDGACSDPVRAFFIQNALYWITDFHIDGLRLDAVDAIYDFGPRHFLAELADAVHARAHELERDVVVIAESDLNDVKVINPPGIGGFGLDAQWNDDLHHALHALVTGERKGYYQDFGQLAHLQKAYEEGFVYSGIYSQYRKKKHGNSSKHIPGCRFVVCSQNHDQIGNRRLGERLSSLISFEQQKLVAGCVLLPPFVPLLFMGEEYAETAPFQYFVSHIDEPLIEAIRKGRAEEFAHFEWEGQVPDPQDEDTFTRCKLHPGLRHEGRHRLLFEFYRELIRLRKATPALAEMGKDTMQVHTVDEEQVLLIQSKTREHALLLAFCFGKEPAVLDAPVPEGRWERILDSSAVLWGGPGEQSGTAHSPSATSISLHLNPESVVLYVRQGGQA
jgi:maltooligosyltrehalose trehalohydrolase